MRTDNLDDKQKSFFDDIKKMSRALLQIINDILDFSKIEAGKLDLTPTHFNLLDLVNNICSLCQFMAESKELEFRHSFDLDVPRIVYGDDVRVHQIITNILNNAIKYTAEGMVSLRVKRVYEHDQGYISFIVKDTGIGIREEDFSKLFSAFDQLDLQKNRKISGTGLGLSISGRLAGLMGGRIDVESEYGKGSVFTVLLPLPGGDPSLVGDDSEPHSHVVSDGRANVLVVDDNRTNIKVALAWLDTHNIQADSAESGAEAIERAREKRYHLLFMDHMMPGMDGIEATARIRALEDEWYRTAPIVALSANAVKGMRDVFLSSGMDDFLAKPIEARELNRVLKKWLPGDMIKIEAREKKDDADVGSQEYDLLLSELDRIEGLDVWSGISGVGGAKRAYINILLQACSEMTGYVCAIRDAFEKYDWDDYAIRMHAMKSAFANIGAGKISRWALDLESASKNGDISKCEKETGPICDAMTEFHEALLKTSLIPAYDRRKKKIARDIVYIEEKLEKLKESCLDGMSDEADQIASELADTSFDEHMEESLCEIRRQVNSYDYEIAVELIEALFDYISSIK
jgi:CheY-like chemotaxis protein/anti-sigma regulatory factor (Ser/Thr protein kinase)